MVEFAARLCQARAARQMTQARLVELLEVDRRVCNQWERNAPLPQLHAVVRIAQVLPTTDDSLVGLEPPTAPRIHNPRLHALCEQLDSFSDEDQQVLIVLMDSLVKRSQMTRLMTS
ncbi:helix-turn-helix transcriptional regulator [Paraburkholderia unamae]|uniref:DNA-binding XRE family transcriptional regulator n=1 Tax=Paraburkholderia unamae TaxID=219649 RepID=A0ABX5KL76_9BURK|nr:helix-turn-helix domain-containing protein [Paraburkholderia unamae]PVX82664.1 DNA-binding XRE family transcriptional regulator [Paraburkholderia unamae]CAG9267584.1 Transcriptional repressor DicA [Paraburkholderia unamae]